MKLYRLFYAPFLFFIIIASTHANEAIATNSPEGFSLFIDSREGSFIGHGEHEYYINETNANMFISSENIGELSITVDCDLNEYLKQWVMEFVTEHNKPFEERLYPYAEGNDCPPPLPRLYVGSSNREPGVSVGSYEVYEITYDDNGNITSLAIDFVQLDYTGVRHGYVPGLIYGAIRYHSNIPVDREKLLMLQVEFAPTPDLEGKSNAGYIDGRNEGYLGERKEFKITDEIGSFYITDDCLNHFTLNYKGGWERSWNFYFAAPDGEVLLPGIYYYASRDSIFHRKRMEPSISIARYSSSSAIQDATFEILEIEYDENQKITKVAIDFHAQTDKGKYNPEPLKGSLRYHSLIPITYNNELEVLERPPYKNPEAENLKDCEKSIYVKSSPGEFVGRGDTCKLTQNEGDIWINRDKCFNKKGIKINFHDPKTYYWSFFFAAPNNETLQPGIYEVSEDHDTVITSNGNACSHFLGKFEVLEIEYDQDGNVIKLALDFNFYDGLKPNNTLEGSIRYFSTIPIQEE